MHNQSMQNDLEKKSILADLFSDRRLGAMLGLGFSSGLPYLLVYATPSAWFKEAGVPLEIIGLMSEMTLAYKLKFLWAPFLDQFDAPILGRLLGRRRGWIAAAQIAVVAALAGVSFGDPAHFLLWNIIFAFLLGFAGATQDVVIDGWRIAIAPPERQGLMSAYAQLGYRIAILCAGAGTLYIADLYSWRAAYLCMALLMSLGLGACYFAAEPERAPSEPHPGFVKAIILPLKDFFSRLGPRAAIVLALVALYRLPDYVSGVMANPLYIGLGFTKSDIATVTKLYGFWIALVGIFAGGVAVSRLGLMRSLLIGAVAASSSHLTLALLASHGARFDLFTLAVSAENFASSFASTALIAYMSSLTSSAFAGSQYALLSSLFALPGTLVGGLSGFMVKSMGYPAFFVATSCIGAPVVILCLIVWRIEAQGTPAPAT